MRSGWFVPVALGFLAFVSQREARAAPDPPASIAFDIETGNRSAARSALEERASAGSRSPESWLHQAMLTPRGTTTLLSRAASAADPDVRLSAQVLLLREAIAAGAASNAIRAAGTLIDSISDGPERSEVQYLLAQAELLSGRASESERRMDWLSRHGAQPWRGWGLYGQARAALGRADTSEALRLLKTTSGLSDHAAVAPALLLLGQLYDARGDAAQAIRYLAMYSEAYPRGMLPLLEHAAPASGTADRAAGIAYTIQVGVFGDRANAVRQKDRFTALGYRVRMVGKSVGGERYTAVWVGSFATQEKALQTRRSLEERFGETYRVVVDE